jgi:hypothetical protein
MTKHTAAPCPPANFSRPVVSQLLFILLLFMAASAFTQSKVSAPYLVPQTVFVGDRARLVVPLEDGFKGEGSIVVEDSAALPPRSQLVVVRRVELDRRIPRLLVDFEAYATGEIELPPVSVGIHEFDGFKVTISSILENDSMELSPPAAPLSLPGTSVTLYGTVIAILSTAIAAFVWGIWGLPKLKEYRVIGEKRRSLRDLRRFIRKAEDLFKTSQDKEEILCALAELSAAFREFMSTCTGINCLSFSPAEFLALPKAIKMANEEDGKTTENTRKHSSLAHEKHRDKKNQQILKYIRLHIEFLSAYFSRSDYYRFGPGATPYEAAKLLGELQEFLDAMTETEPARRAG